MHESLLRPVAYVAVAKAAVVRPRKPATFTLATPLLMAFLLASRAHPLYAVELQPGTLASWNSYIKAPDSKMEERAAGHVPFLWLDESPDRAARVRQGGRLHYRKDSQAVSALPVARKEQREGGEDSLGNALDLCSREFRPILIGSSRSHV